jgi:GR25 family glycosyltransferase involved in LPS biosynthesis
VKRIGCYEVNGVLDWRSAQAKAAQQGKAPPPEEVPMEAVRHPEMCERPDLGNSNASTGEEQEAARLWVNSHVAIYIINLDKSKGRWATVSAMLQQHRLNFTRIPGVDLSVPHGMQGAKASGFIPSGFDFELAQRSAKSEYQGMGGILGTVGCAAAHLNAMHVAANNYIISPTKQLAVILEDDVDLVWDFAVRLKRLLQTEAPCDWQAISLRSRCPYGVCVSPHLTRVLPDGNEPADRCRHGVNYGFFAMLYRLDTLSVLRDELWTTVWDAWHPRCLDVDVAFASISDRIAYYAVPFLQAPGFLTEGNHGSSRFTTNQQQSAA